MPGVSNDGLCHVVIRYDVLLCCMAKGPPRPLLRPSNPSTYCLNCAVNIGQCSRHKCKSYLCNTNYNSYAARFPLDDYFAVGFSMSLSAITLPQSRRKAYGTTESRSYTQIAIVNCVQINVSVVKPERSR